MKQSAIPLFIATRNSHKTAEIQHILGSSVLVSDATQVQGLPEVEETGITFEANACLKAEALSAVLSGWVLADDSGLEVDALKGEPGIYSARYARAGRSDLENTELVLEKMRDIPEGFRSARFKCVLAVAQGGKVVATFHGTVEGTVATTMSGKGGFGYDPIFIPRGYTQSFGDLPSSVKHEMSHRRRALEKFQTWLETKV